MRRKLYKLKARASRSYKIRLIRLKRSNWRHPIIVPIATFLTLTIISVGLFLLFNGGSAKFRPITSYIAIISYDHTQETIPTDEPTVGALLKKLDITLGQGDVVEPSLSTQINEDNFRINIYRAVPVEIVEGTSKTFTFSAATTPRSIVEQAGVKIYPEDYVNIVPTQNFIAAAAVGEEVVINPATPVSVNLYGTPTVLRTHAQTVGGLLKSSNITLRQGDSVQPSASTPITEGMQVFLIHKGTQIKTVQQTIPAPVQTVQDSSLTIGTSAIRQAGAPGSELVTYELSLQNGVVVGQTAIQTVVTQSPVTQIVADGTASLGGSLQEWLYNLRECESSGNYQDDTGNDYYGAYQFSASTWDKWNTGYAYAYEAPPEVQDTVIIENTNASSGGLATQNPGCYAKEGLSAFPPG
jgi:uncharacterized protein YabE (DUF348 family)